MVQIYQTKTGIYYLHDYIPVKKFRYHSEEEIAMSKLMWQYKNGDSTALNIFTNELMYAVTAITNGIRSDRVGLVAVPSSKVERQSTIITSIWNMVNWYNLGIAKTNFGCNKRLYDYSTLLTRVSDIGTARKGNRESYDVQMKSLACSRDNLSKYWTTFVILDDVTTIGTSMDVCRDMLLEHGAKEKYIIRLAIAKTI